MRVQHNGQRAHPAAVGSNGEPKGDLAGERDHSLDGTDQNGLQAPYRHHVDSVWRRRKTDAELIAGCEFFELAERGVR